MSLCFISHWNETKETVSLWVLTGCWSWRKTVFPSLLPWARLCSASLLFGTIHFFLPFLWRLNLSHCEWEPLRDSRFCNGSSSVPARLSFIFNFLPICGPRTNNETADGKRRRLLSTFPIKFGHLKWDFIFFIFSTAGYTRWNICLVTHIGSLVQPELFKIYLFCLKEGWLFSYQSCRNAGWHKRTPKTEISFFVNPSQTFSVEIISPWLFPQHLTQIHIIPSPFFCPFASQLSDLLLYHLPVFPRLSFSLSSGLPSHPFPSSFPFSLL